jgi:hypothetical protein
MRKKITLIFLSCLSIISILLTSCVETDTETSIDGLMAGNGFFVYEIPLGGAGTWLEGDGTWSVPVGGGGVPGGLDTQVQYNNGGAFGGDAGLVYDDALNDLTADGSITSTNGDIVTTTGDINSGNDVNVTNDLDVTDDADVGGDLVVVGDTTANAYFGNGENLTLSTLGASTYDTLQELMNAFGSTGQQTGGVITDNGTADGVNVTAGTGFIKATDNDTGELMFFDFPSGNDIAIPSNSTRYIGVTYNAGIPQIEAHAIFDWDLDTEFALGRVVSEVINGVDTLHILNSPWWVTDGTTNIIERIRAEGLVVRDEAIGGLMLSVTGTRNVAVTAGTLWSNLNEFPMPAIDTSVIGTFEYYWYSAANGWQMADIDNYSVLQWNDTTLNVLQNITVNKYCNIWVYAESDDTEIALLYPQVQYNTAAQAEAAQSPILVPDHIANEGILIGKIVIRQGTDAAVEVLSAFTNTFSPSLISDHGNLAGLSDDDHPQYLLIADIDDTPVDGATTAPISSNWAFDHDVAATGVHGAGANTLLNTGDIDDTPSNGDTSDAISSNWAYDHYVDWTHISKGATVPVAPTEGQLFYHTPTGRKILLVYNGTNWQPIESFGTMTVYVDSWDGSDNPNFGTGVDGDAFATVQYAVDMIPGQVGGNVIININAESYAETVTIQGKSLTGNYSITLQGTLTAHETHAQTASVQGATTTLGSISDTTNDPFAGHAGDLLYSSNNAEYRVIDSVTTEVATVVGYWTAAPTGNYTIYTWATDINNIVVSTGQLGVVCNDIKFDTAVCAIVNVGASVTFERCYFTAASTTFFINGGNVYIDTCRFLMSGAAYAINAGQGATGTVVLSKFELTHTDATGILVNQNSSIMMGEYPNGLNSIDGTAGAAEALYGIQCTGGGFCSCEATYSRIRDLDTGIAASQGGVVIYTANNQYSGNTVNEVATAASYGYID